ncbi:MAG: hypothetical protein BZ151_02150 [Desulfobacca sp. 4484_104]|nr:MAG: hypothetical protein BZ151_02150 [Desulfobacca sp. 4484_104]RLA88358.1 MAG: hypothetical protein DRG58_08205 [Deltaproteobacteria bacterium]
MDKVEDLVARREDQRIPHQTLLEEEGLSAKPQMARLKAENLAIRQENQFLQEKLASCQE